LATLAGLAVLGTAVFTALAVGQQANAPAQGARRSFVVEQQAPCPLHGGPASRRPEPGNMLAFEAAIRSEDGTPAPWGNLITVDLPEDDPLRTVWTTSSFDFGARGSIVAAGGSAKDTREMAVDRPQVRGVVGGSVAFIGARGHVTTTRNADGTYEHRFELPRSRTPGKTPRA
jgi:hypothetical protein